MAIEIRRDELTSAVAKTLITALNAELSAIYTGEGETFFSLDPTEVAEGQGAFLVAYRDGTPVGCGAIRKLDDRDAEIKRMYVDPQTRGAGVGGSILGGLETEAARLGVTRVVLETGDKQHAAIAMYKRHGYRHIAAFGPYVDSPVSVCMAKSL